MQFVALRSIRRTVVAVSLVSLVGITGCAPEPAPPASEAPRAVKASPAPTASTATAPASPAPSTTSLLDLAEAGYETWDVVRLQGARVGYGHLRFSRVGSDDEPQVRIDGVHRLSMQRFGQANEQEMRLTSIETPQGALLDFRSETIAGPSPLLVQGRVEGDELVVERGSGEQATTKRIDWKPSAGGFFATEVSLLQQPMQPGEQRNLQTLMPMFDDVLIAEVALQAQDYENVSLPEGEHRLLRIANTARMPLGEITSTLWVDEQGEIHKSLVDAFGQETYRATQAEALAQITGEEETFDLGFNTVVQVDESIPRPHQTHRARYRVHLTGGDPTTTFADGNTQTVEAVDDETVEITVESIRPTDLSAAPPGEALDEDRSPNSIIQSDDPRIERLAQAAAGDETDPVQVALALERYVHESITSKNFSQAFATAAEVAESLEGDCTEHAVLLAALARARGIPARVAIGLVYLGSEGGFFYHMWNEVYLDGHWVPLDATLGQGGIGAAHLKITDSHLNDASAYSCFLPVAEVVGRLKIDVLEAE